MFTITRHHKVCIVGFLGTCSQSSVIIVVTNHHGSIAKQLHIQTPMAASSDVPSAPGQPVVVNDAEPRMSMIDELREFRQLPEFSTSVSCIETEKKKEVAVRQILSHHKSTACQPGKADGTAGPGQI